MPATLAPDLLEKWTRIGAPQDTLTVGQIYFQVIRCSKPRSRSNTSNPVYSGVGASFMST